MSKDFVLDPRLAADCHPVGDWPLCRLLLMDDARWPWFILVPRRTGLRELCDLGVGDRSQLWLESAAISVAMRTVFTPHKLNIAALGNVVEQLHLHHLARSPGDPGWPAPVWGFGKRVAYPAAARVEVIERLAAALASPPVRPAGAGTGG